MNSQYTTTPLILILIIVSIGFFSGCAKYTPHKFQLPIGSVNEKNGVQVIAEPLTDGDCQHYFSRRPHTKGYQPIMLFVKNESNYPYILDAQDIDLHIEDRDHVAKNLHLNTVGRVVGWGLPGLFLWPFLIPAACEGVKSNDANTKLNNDFNQRVMSYDSRIFVAPGASINKVLFVTLENYRNSFNVALENKQTNEMIDFTINV